MATNNRKRNDRRQKLRDMITDAVNTRKYSNPDMGRFSKRSSEASETDVEIRSMADHNIAKLESEKAAFQYNNSSRGQFRNLFLVCLIYFVALCVIGGLAYNGIGTNVGAANKSGGVDISTNNVGSTRDSGLRTTTSEYYDPDESVGNSVDDGISSYAPDHIGEEGEEWAHNNLSDIRMGYKDPEKDINERKEDPN